MISPSRRWSVRLFFVLCEWKHEGNIRKPSSCCEKREIELCTQVGKRERKGRVRSNIQRESPGKREMWMVSARPWHGRWMRKEVEGTCYIYTTHDLFTHTRPFPPLRRRPQLGRGRKKAHSLSLSPGLTAEEGCAAFKLPPKSLQIQQSAKFHTKTEFFPMCFCYLQKQM